MWAVIVTYENASVVSFHHVNEQAACDYAARIARHDEHATHIEALPVRELGARQAYAKFLKL